MPMPKTVYVVDDDAAVRDSLAALLDSHGFYVSEHASGAHFLHAFQGSRQGCIILDIHMPGIGGLELLEYLRGKNIQIPVIAITGRGDPALRERLIQSGALAVFDKPVEEDQLVHAIETAFARVPT